MKIIAIIDIDAHKYSLATYFAFHYLRYFASAFTDANHTPLIRP